MAITAKPQGGVSRNLTLKLAHSAAVVAGEVIVSNTQTLVAVEATVINAAGAYVFRGPVLFPKKSSLAIALGDKVYWDADPGEITKTEGDGVFCGVCIGAVAGSGTTVLVELMSNVALATHTH